MPVDKPIPSIQRLAQGEIDQSTLCAAERLAGLCFSDESRGLILEDIDEQMTRILSLRAIPIPNEIAPATRFNPLLPGQRLPSANPRIFSEKEISLPTAQADIAFAALLDQARWLREGQLTSVELTEIYLDRIARFDGTLNAFITVTADRALIEARRADAEIAAGHWRGPLHGIPWAAKDLLATGDAPTTWGSALYREQRFPNDATVVKRLAAQGAVLLGKTALGALALGDVWFGGQTRNPYNLDEGATGSSAGSAAAVAAGLASFAIGSETMGSIVNPSIRCGVVGLRPTFGRVPRTGAMALAWSLDKIGPICRTPEDALAVLADINGPDGVDQSTINAPVNYDANASLDGLRVGFHPRWIESISTSRDTEVLNAIENLGVELVEIELPSLPYAALWNVLFCEAAAAFDRLTVSGTDALLERQDRFAWPNLLRKARYISAVDHLQTERFRRLIMQEMHQLFSQVDLLVGSLFSPYVQLITNCTGHPALTFRAGEIECPTRDEFPPIGVAAEPRTDEVAHRVPHGLVLWGNLYREDQLINVAEHLESVLDQPRPIRFRA